MPLGHVAINQLRGGPETLLRWLEIQLGLPTRDSHRANFVTEYASALDSVTDSMISRSLKTDRWATAAELLLRRDELLLSGWNPAESDALPIVVQDLAKAATGRRSVFLCVADRLRRIVEALDVGQQLPSHICTLTEPPEMWPQLWREVLTKLTTVPAKETLPAAALGTALHRCQSAVRGQGGQRIGLDTSLRFVLTLSQMSAVEFVAATLANSPNELAGTVIACDDDALAMQLDACLNRLGLPTMGVSFSSKAHPVLQVLPLCLALCWEPVNPQSLLDFLSLPVSPIPRAAASRLAEALSEEPGLGSSCWQAALETLLASENDPEKKLAERLDNWLFGERVVQGESISSRLIADRCGLVAQWAIMRAIAMGKDNEPSEQLIHALHVAAAQASLLGDLVQNQGTHLSEPQLARLLEEALADGVETTRFIEAEGGPTRVCSLAEIDQPCQRLIWLGLGTNDAAGCRWSAEHVTTFRAEGIHLDDGSNALSALRSAEATGLCHVQKALLAISLPQDLERRWHPIWLAIRNVLSKEDLENPLVLENLISAGDVTPLAPFTFPLQTSDIEPAHGRRGHWEIPADLIEDRDKVSASELQDRLACPLKWVLNYQAHLRPSAIARLPDDFQLRGTFCHSILERVFGNGGDLPAVDAAVAQVAEAFDQRIALDAAPLAQPDKYLERQKLRKELENATKVLIDTLACGGYRIKGIEVEVSGEAFGKSLVGRIDCLAERDGGNAAIIDFKYSGRKKYSTLIEKGRAVQLATYAYARSTSNGTFPAVAYLILSDGLLFTPSGSPIEDDTGRSVIEGMGIQEVWEAFSNAIETADGWLTGLSHVPARPLLHVEDWPDGSDIVLDKDLKSTDVQPVCQYCDYKILCGLQELY